MDLTVVLPWKDIGCEHRSTAWRFVRTWYEREFPEARLFLSSPTPWSRARAIITGIHASRTDSLIVVADSDSYCEGLRTGIAAVEAGAVWAVPHLKVHRLTHQSTERIYTDALNGKPVDRLQCSPQPYRGTAAGGMLVARVSTLLRVPPDRRFMGWGSEDGAWRDALRTLAGYEWRENSDPLIHLWHPPESLPRKSSPENTALARRYVSCRGDVRRMRSLLEESLPQ